jgi:CTP synthase (UTP-ammonia lyase)
MARIAILGEFDASREPRVATGRAIQHAANKLGVEIDFHWVPTDEIDEKILSQSNGTFIAPGSPYRDMQKVLRAIREARERRTPCIGTCGGFQHMVMEFARNVLGMQDAQHEEYDPDALDPLISHLDCSLAGREMEIRLTCNSLVARIYGKLSVREKYSCSYGVNPRYAESFKTGPMRVVGSDNEGVMRAIELQDHPFFIGTLFVPQVLSTEERPHPLVSAFLKAVINIAEQAPEGDRLMPAPYVRRLW